MWANIRVKKHKISIIIIMIIFLISLNLMWGQFNTLNIWAMFIKIKDD